MRYINLHFTYLLTYYCYIRGSVVCLSVCLSQ